MIRDRVKSGRGRRPNEYGVPSEPQVPVYASPETVEVVRLFAALAEARRQRAVGPGAHLRRLLARHGWRVAYDVIGGGR